MVVFVKWILVPIFWISADTFSWFGWVCWFGIVAVLLFTVFWPLLVFFGWFFGPSDRLAH